MWQRKQTLFLLAVVVLMTLSIFFPIWQASSEGIKKVLFPIHYSVFEGGGGDTIYFPYCSVAILCIASATLALIEIGKFKNRALQIKLGALNSLFMAGAIGLAVYFATDFIKMDQVAGEYGVGLFLPAIAMISNIVANRFIRKDEQMVKDSERIR